MKQFGIAAGVLLWISLALWPAMGQAPSQPPYAHGLFTGPVHELPTPAFDAEHLALTLTLDPDAGRIEGTATYHLRPLEAAATVTLLATGLDVSSVHAGPPDSSRRAQQYTVEAGRLSITLDSLLLQAPAFEVEIAYAATPKRGLEVHADGQWAWADPAPGSLDHWLPHPDAPAERLTWSLDLTLPAAFNVLTGHPADEVTRQPQRQRRHQFHTDRPVPLYRIGFVAGPFTQETDTVAPPGQPALALTYAVPDGMTNRLAPTFETLPAVLGQLAALTRTPFPDSTFTWAAIPDLPRPLRLAGLAAFDAGMLRDTRSLADGPPSHGLAMMLAPSWFGVHTTLDHWADTWLLDALPAFLAARVLHALDGPETYTDLLLAALDAYHAETTRYHRPVVWDQWSDPALLHDAHAWAKGLWILHMLQAQVGAEAFSETLALLLTRHGGGYLHTDRLIEALEETGHEPMGPFFDRWVFSSGHPSLQLRYRAAGRDTVQVTLRQTQTGFLVPETYQLTLDLAVHTLAGPTDFTVALDSTSQTYLLPVRGMPRFILLDPTVQQLRHVAVEQPVTAWAAQLRYAPEALSRRAGAEALRAFPDDPALLIVLRQALENEPTPSVREAVVETISARPPTASAARLLTEALQDEAVSVRIAAVKGLGGFAGLPGVAEAVRQQAFKARSYRVQAAAVAALARLGTEDALAVIQSALITPSQGEVVRQAALRALGWLTVPETDVIALALPFAAPEHPVAVRAAALALLGTRLAEEVELRPMFEAAVADPHPVIRNVAWEALDGLPAAEWATLLERRISEEQDPILHQHLLERQRRNSAPKGP